MAVTGADAADALLRVAVLLQAGITPARAWRHLADSGDPAAVGVIDRHERGESLPEAIAATGADWAHVGAAWSVAATVGAPLAETLRGFAGALRDAQDAADQVRIALAEPTGTARLMAWLPLVGIALGAALGFDTLAILVTHPIGIACLVGGGILVVAARRWTAALVRRAQTAPPHPGLEAELTAIALSGGVSIDRARAIVAAAMPAALPGAPPDAPPGDDVEATLRLSRSAGAPAVELLRAAAALARHRARVDGRLRAASLSSRLLLPLGVCTLPAFLLLGVAPMMLSILSTMSLSL